MMCNAIVLTSLHSLHFFVLAYKIKFIYICHMNYNKEIERLGLKKIFIAKKLNISNTLLSFYLNDVYPIPEEIELKLHALLKAYDVN